LGVVWGSLGTAWGQSVGEYLISLELVCSWRVVPDDSVQYHVTLRRVSLDCNRALFSIGCATGCSCCRLAGCQCVPMDVCESGLDVMSLLDGVDVT